MEDDEKDTSIANDGGWGSRKLWFCVFSVFAVLASGIVAPVAAVATVVAGIVTIAGIYVTGRAIVQWKAGSVEQTTVTTNGPVAKAVEKVVAKVEEKVKSDPADDDRG